MTDYPTTHIVFFSPTHTSARIARAVGEGVGMECRIETDLTLDEGTTPIEIADALTIVAAPVYGGRVAPVALQRIKRLKGRNAPAILIAVYGNRDYEDALAELRDTVVGLGFTPLSAGAFIGEHSYSTPRLPIAAGRPDAEDLQKARQFGKDSLKKLAEAMDAGSVTPPAGISDLQSTNRLKGMGNKLSLLLHSFFIKGTSPYKLIQAGKPSCPVCTDQCFVCGECTTVCPTHAIRTSDDGSRIETDVDRCIRCCACVKECPNEARTFDTPFAAILHEKFNTRREPELFF